ncbi:hypothetical protein LguiB_014233 [Lonicera macranthoides]
MMLGKERKPSHNRSKSFSIGSSTPHDQPSSSSWLSGIMARGRRLDKSASSKMSVPSSPTAAAASNSPGGGGDIFLPISRKNHFHGVMFKYGPNPIQVAFKTGDYKQHVIFIGGLTDGFLATDYTHSRSPPAGSPNLDKPPEIFSTPGVPPGATSRGTPRVLDLDYIRAMLQSSLEKYTLSILKGSQRVESFMNLITYLQPLAIALEKEKWSLVQFLLLSSYSGYGISSLKKDAMDIDQLVSYLINKEDSEGVVLLGHSTGCQDIVYYMRTNSACSKAVRGAIFQAPVSDREYKAMLPETAAMIDLASKLISEGRGSELMPWNADPDSPITAYRYHSLCAYMGDDDMFSSDLSDDQLKQRLGHLCTTPCQIIFSMADEYVPDHVDKKALVDRLCKAMGGAEKVEIEWGKHKLSNRVEEVVQAILGFVKREGPCGWDDPWS